MRDEIILGAVGVVCVAAMTIAAFYFTGENGTILAAAAGSIGTIIGIVLGRASVTFGGTRGTGHGT